jgi:hypothetical protein
MAYAEKHGRGWRARWRDQDGGLRSASGFASRKAADGYGSDREAGYRFYSFTRAQLIDAIATLEVHVATSGPAAGKILAESMADAIIGALDDAGERAG